MQDISQPSEVVYCGFILSYLFESKVNWEGELMSFRGKTIYVRDSPMANDDDVHTHHSTE